MFDKYIPIEQIVFFAQINHQMNSKNAQNALTVLVTGVTGYLGSHLSKKLVERGHRVIGLLRQNSLKTRLESFEDSVKLYTLENEGITKAFSQNSIDVVIHCATCYGRKNESDLEILAANYDFPVEVLNKGKRSGLKYFINTHTLLAPDTNSYSRTKHKFLNHIASDSSNINFLNISLEHFYGPADDSTKFVSWLVKNALQKVNSLPLTQGTQFRDFIYIDDVVAAYIQLLDNLSDFTSKKMYLFEVGSGNAVQVKDLVELIFKLCKNETTVLEFGKIAYRDNEKMTANVDLTAMNKLGWHPKFDLLEGLKTTIQMDALTIQRKL